jgi:enoyl-CoA hydratase/carnithine racemase
LESIAVCPELNQSTRVNSQVILNLVENLGIVYDFLEESNINELISSIIVNAPKAIYSGFKAIKKLGELSEIEKIPFLLQCLEDLKQTQDAKEGMSAFFEKRDANWLNE